MESIANILARNRTKMAMVSTSILSIRLGIAVRAVLSVHIIQVLDGCLYSRGKSLRG
jgi:hypothetical protein